MKKLLLFIGFALSTLYSIGQAKLDLEISPIELLFTKISVSAERDFSENVGVEFSVGYDWSFFEDEDINVFGASLSGKYYLFPESGIDKLYIGAYSRYMSFVETVENESYSRLTFGFRVGYKWVSSKNVILETGAGFGRELYSNSTITNEDVAYPYDFMMKLSVGYRF